MDIRGLHHYAWKCVDAKKTIDFYSGILNLSNSDISLIQSKYGVRPKWNKWLLRLKGYFGRPIVE